MQAQIKTIDSDLDLPKRKMSKSISECCFYYTLKRLDFSSYWFDNQYEFAYINNKHYVQTVQVEVFEKAFTVRVIGPQLNILAY